MTSIDYLKKAAEVARSDERIVIESLIELLTASNVGDCEGALDELQKEVATHRQYLIDALQENGEY